MVFQSFHFVCPASLSHPPRAEAPGILLRDIPAATTPPSRHPEGKKRMPERPDDPGCRLDLAEILEFFRRLEPSEHSIDEEQRIGLRYQFYPLCRKPDPSRFLGQRWECDKTKIDPGSA